MLVSRETYFIAILCVLCSCVEEKKQSTLTIHAENFSNPIVTLYFQDQFGYAENLLGSSTLDSSGFAIITYELEKTAFGTINIGDESSIVYLVPGEDLSVAVDCKQFHEQIVFDDHRPGINNFLMERYLLLRQLENSADDYLEDLNPESVVALINEFSSRLEKQLIEYEELTNFEKELIRVKNNYLLWYIDLLFQMFIRKAMQGRGVKHPH